MGAAVNGGPISLSSFSVVTNAAQRGFVSIGPAKCLVCASFIG